MMLGSGGMTTGVDVCGCDLGHAGGTGARTGTLEEAGTQKTLPVIFGARVGLTAPRQADAHVGPRAV